MNIALIIIAGLTGMTLIASLFDYLGKRAKSKMIASADKLLELEKRLTALENTLADRDEKILQLEKDLGFFTKLLENKTGKEK